MGFPLTPRSMTLDDLELLKGLILLKFRDISRVLEAITAKRMKIDLYCQQRNCSPLNILFSDVQIALISKVVQGASNNVEVAKTSLRTHTAIARLLVLARLSCLY